MQQLGFFVDGEVLSKNHANLTAEQHVIVQKRDGVFAVIAVPGSGKTHTMVARCDSLTGESCLALAFNVDAAKTFKARLKVNKHAQVKTVNSFCFQEFMRNWNKLGMEKKPDKDVFYKYINGLDLESLIASGATRARSWEAAGLDKDMIKHYEGWFLDSELVAEQTARRAALLDATLSDGAAEENKNKLRHVEIVLHYRNWLLTNSIYTHQFAVRLLAQNPEAITSRYDHVFVDEFQDIDRFQWKVIRELGKDAKSFMVVGDPNQRIYEWRGAMMDAFGIIRAEFPSTEVLRLSTNFRSYSEITGFAESFCPAGMEASRGSKPGSVVHSKGLPLLLPEIAKNPKSFAVLCRYRMECVETKLALYKARIPAKIRKERPILSIPHIAMAYETRLGGDTLDTLLTSPRWIKLMSRLPYSASLEDRVDAKIDAEILHSLTNEDFKLLSKIDDEKEGVFIATVHGTKGAEFDNVIFRFPDNPVTDLYVNYVAVTRAKNQLLLLPASGERIAYNPPQGASLKFLT